MCNIAYTPKSSQSQSLSTGAQFMSLSKQDASVQKVQIYFLITSDRKQTASNFTFISIKPQYKYILLIHSTQ